MNGVVRVVLALIAGYAVTASTVIGVISVAAALLVHPGSLPSRTYLVANIAGSFAGAVVGGFVTALIAGPPHLVYASLLGALILALGALMARSGAQPGQPQWYPWVIPIVGAAGALSGGLL
jgi:hypothetical protein